MNPVSELEPPDERDRGTDLRLALGLGMLCAVGYVILWRLAPTITPDGFIYLELAKNLFTQGYQVLGEPHAKFLPLYPALMALCNLVTAGRFGADAWGFLLSLLSGAALPPLFFLLARRFGASRPAGLAVAFIQALLPLGLHQYCDINVLPLFTFLFTLTLFSLAHEKYFWAGVAGGLAVTTRYEFYLFLPLLLIAKAKKPRAWLWFGLGLLLAAGPWWARNFALYRQLNHTYYLAELTRGSFHLPEIVKGMLIQFGPVLLLAAALGFFMLSRPWKIYAAGFSFLYLLLHVIWWYYHDRFLLPLAPLILVPAALGLDRAREYAARHWKLEPRRVFAALLILASAQVLALAGYFFYLGATSPPAPAVQAGRALKEEPGNQAALATNSLMIAYYSGRPAYPLPEPARNQSPHPLVLQRCLQNHARFLVWVNTLPLDYAAYNFLKAAADHRVQVSTPEGNYELAYLFYREFKAPGKFVRIYELQARRLE